MSRSFMCRLAGQADAEASGIDHPVAMAITPLRCGQGGPAVPRDAINSETYPTHGGRPVLERISATATSSIGSDWPVEHHTTACCAGPGPAGWPWPAHAGANSRATVGYGARSNARYLHGRALLPAKGQRPEKGRAGSRRGRLRTPISARNIISSHKSQPCPRHGRISGAVH